MSVRIPIDSKKIADFCNRHPIRRLALFVSVLRDDFRPDSDVDVLVEFEPGQTPGFIRLLDMARKALDLVRGKNRQDCQSDETLRFALAHLVQVIGEAARRVSKQFCDAPSQILWKAIVGMRHKVMHDDMNKEAEQALVDLDDSLCRLNPLKDLRCSVQAQKQFPTAECLIF